MLLLSDMKLNLALRHWELLFFSGLLGVIGLYPYLEFSAAFIAWIVDLVLAGFLLGYVLSRHLLQPVQRRFIKHWQEIIGVSLAVNLLLVILIMIGLMIFIPTPS